MSGPVLFSMNANDRRVYLVKREAELTVSNPHLCNALRLDELRSDQQTALFQALEIIAISPQLSRETVANAMVDPAQLMEEARYIDNVRWTQAVSPLAFQVGGAIERRNAVRSRLCLALRAARLAASQ